MPEPAAEDIAAGSGDLFSKAIWLKNYGRNLPWEGSEEAPVTLSSLMDGNDPRLVELRRKMGMNG